jgi:uncharacterized protein (DUF885 family)
MPSSGSDALADVERQVVDHYFVLRPTQAASLGLHQYDGILPDLSRESTQRWSQKAQDLLRRLESIDDSQLPTDRRLDRRILELLLEGAEFDLDSVQELDRNPMSYLLQPNLTDYLARDYAPVDDRVRAITRVLAAVPELLEAATGRLVRAIPRPYLVISIPIAKGLPELFDEAEAFAAGASGPARNALKEARAAADGAVTSFAEWLQQERMPHATEDFALGQERFQRLLWVREGLRTPVEEVARRGRGDLERNQRRLEEIARKEGVSAEQLIVRLNDQHPSPAELIPLAQRLTDEAREFVRESEFATIPEPESCKVRETPPWARDLWTGALSPPGPFEVPVDGIFWVTTADPSWTPSQKEEWMRTYNFSMMKNLTVHEVWPGHYLQALHFRRTDQSLARKVWFSYSFCEGWAHYCEQAALEVGYDRRSTRAEVSQLKDALTRDVRLLASIGMHTQGMTVEGAERLFRTEAHLEPIHAQREAIRGTYNPEYFCYTLGKLAILEARSKYMENRYRSSLKGFHDALLAFGTPPIGFLDALVSGSFAF